LIFFIVPVLTLLPIPKINIVLLLPLLIWVNVVGLPFAMIGVPYFEIHEFGAVPQGVIGYGLIVLGYVLAAFFLSMVGIAEDKNSTYD